MNNKGQVLISFIILIPLFIMLIGIVTDTGYLLTEKRRIENNIKFSLRNNCDTSCDKTKIKKHLKSNIDDIETLNIDAGSNYAIVEIKKKKKSIFGNVFKNLYYDIDLKYKGTIKNNKVIIEKE